MPPASRKSIVLVDDEKSYSELLTQMLAENLDCPVHAFSRPLDTLQALPALNAAVVVTDYFMPQIDGLDFIRRAAPLVPKAVFVLISGHNLTAHEDEMARLKSLKAYIPKPFGWRKLADEILRVWPDETDVPAHRADATSL
ncbi:MAG TPA: response regulator [Opitutaceae bacterium]|nr:response regulator [Opitutaceae bacterium]